MLRKILQALTMTAVVFGIPALALAATSGASAGASAGDCCCPLCCSGK